MASVRHRALRRWVSHRERAPRRERTRPLPRRPHLRNQRKRRRRFDRGTNRRVRIFDRSPKRSERVLDSGDRDGQVVRMIQRVAPERFDIGIRFGPFQSGRHRPFDGAFLRGWGGLKAHGVGVDGRREFRDDRFRSSVTNEQFGPQLAERRSEVGDALPEESRPVASRLLVPKRVRPPVLPRTELPRIETVHTAESLGLGRGGECVIVPNSEVGSKPNERGFHAPDSVREHFVYLPN